MGIPYFFRYLLTSAKNAIVKRGTIGRVDSVSIDLNGLLHKAFSLIYMISLTDKVKELMKISQRLMRDGKENKNKNMIKESNELLEQANTLQKQYDEGIALIAQGEKALSQGKDFGKYKVRDGQGLINE